MLCFSNDSLHRLTNGLSHLTLRPCPFLPKGCVASCFFYGLKNKWLLVVDTLKKGAVPRWFVIWSEKEDPVAMHVFVDIGEHLVLIDGLEIGQEISYDHHVK